MPSRKLINLSRGAHSIRHFLPSISMSTPFVSIGMSGHIQCNVRLSAPFSTKAISANRSSSIIDQSLSTASPPFLIGVSGGTASGKTTVCEEIIKRLSNQCKPLVAVISQDSYYRELRNAEEKDLALRGDFNFDHPDALDFELMLATLEHVKRGKEVSVPSYDFKTNARVPNCHHKIPSVDVVLFEGIMAFYFEPIRKMFDLKLFVDADPDTRLARRVVRDIRDRGRTLEHIFHQYFGFVKPAYEDFCLPTKKYADIIIPGGADNHVAIELIVKHIQELLRSRNEMLDETSRSRFRTNSEQ